MMDASALRIAGLLASRLCHDLVGPLGAVSNGLELIAEEDAMAKEALGLAQRSAKRASSRLQFFRYAFGAAGGEANFGHGEARPVVLNLLNNGDIAIDWPEAKAVELPAGAGRSGSGASWRPPAVHGRPRCPHPSRQPDVAPRLR